MISQEDLAELNCQLMFGALQNVLSKGLDKVKKELQKDKDASQQLEE